AQASTASASTAIRSCIPTHWHRGTTRISVRTAARDLRQKRRPSTVDIDWLPRLDPAASATPAGRRTGDAGSPRRWRSCPAGAGSTPGDLPYRLMHLNGGATSVRHMTDTRWLDATQQAELIRTGEVSPKELVEAAIARIEELNPELNAVIRTRFDQARAEASGDLPNGPFRGVPFLLKDIACACEGEPNSFGVGPLLEMPWPVTSFLAMQFRAAGFIPLGYTNVPEMGTTVTTEARSFPPARNPWNRNHS